jgi:hypothetical protein
MPHTPLFSELHAAKDGYKATV